MKRFLAAALLLAAMAGSAGATAVAYNQALVSTVVTTSATYTLDMSASVIDLLSMSASMSSATPASPTFNDGQVSTGAFTLTSTATLKGARATDTLTVTAAAALVPDEGSNTITVSSNGASALAGAVITLTAEGNTFTFKQGAQWGVGASSAATASSIAAAINGQRYWLASASFGVVTIDCANNGLNCNGYTLASSTPTALAAGSANFTGGQDNSYFLINSQMYVQGVDWTADVAFASNTAVAIANSINANDTQGVTASTTASTVVTITAKAFGTAGNAFTLAVSTPALTVGNASFSGGRAHPAVQVGAVTVTEGTDWAVSDATDTVVSLANALGAASGTQVSTSTTLQTTSGTITVTSLTPGVNAYKLFTNAASGISKTGLAMTGGSATALSGSALILPSHGLATGMQVLYSTGSGFSITGLVNQTTYYVIAVDANDIKLSATSTGSYAGAPITLTDTSLAGPHSFTLTPLPLSGNVVLTWQVSNDNINWANVNLAVATFSSPYATTATLWDFTTINFPFVRANIAGPTQGGMNLKITGFGKRYGSGL